MIEEFENKLRQLGLTQNETKVYISLIELGESKTGPLIKNSKVGSGRIYEILDSLILKGLVSFVNKNNIKFYKALPLENIEKFIDNKKNHLDQLKNSINSLIPKINQNKSLESGTVVEVFEGLEGIKNAFEKQTNFPSGSKLYCWGIDPIKTYDKKIIDYFRFNLFKKRKKFKIKKIFDIAAKGEKDLLENAEIKYEPTGTLSDIEIIEDLTIIFIHQKQNLAITIKNKELADSLTNSFNEIWRLIK